MSYGPDKALEEYRGQDSATIRFSLGSELSYGVAYHSVSRYKNSSVAKDIFRDFVLPSAWGNPPRDWVYKSHIADQSIFSCYDYEGREPPICAWAARYEEYVVQFRARIIAQRMSLHDIERVVMTVDRIMAEKLSK